MSSTSVALLVGLLIVVMGGAAEATDTKFVSSVCNTQKIPWGNPFFNNLGVVFADLKKNTAFSGYEYRASRAGSGGAPTAYGHESANSRCLSMIVAPAFLTSSVAAGEFAATPSVLEFISLTVSSSVSNKTFRTSHYRSHIQIYTCYVAQ